MSCQMWNASTVSEFIEATVQHSASCVFKQLPKNSLKTDTTILLPNKTKGFFLGIQLVWFGLSCKEGYCGITVEPMTF